MARQAVRTIQGDKFVAGRFGCRCREGGNQAVATPTRFLSDVIEHRVHRNQLLAPGHRRPQLLIARVLST
jgi:hypothetical protein